MPNSEKHCQKPNARIQYFICHIVFDFKLVAIQGF